MPGNEAADKLAKAVATTTDTPPRPIAFATTKALIQLTIIDPPPNKKRTAEVYENFSWKEDCIANSNRAYTILLARL